MAHFAELDENNIVKQVLVVPNSVEHYGELYLSRDLNLGGRWVQTSYNGNIRKNYAGIGYTYDEVRDAFIPPKPYPSWYLNGDTCQWQAPKQVPDLENRYIWNEENLNWQLVEGV
jgi:hypothetical protein